MNTFEIMTNNNLNYDKNHESKDLETIKNKRKVWNLSNKAIKYKELLQKLAESKNSFVSKRMTLSLVQKGLTVKKFSKFQFKRIYANICKNIEVNSNYQMRIDFTVENEK